VIPLQKLLILTHLNCEEDNPGHDAEVGDGFYPNQGQSIVLYRTANRIFAKNFGGKILGSRRNIGRFSKKKMRNSQ